MDLFNIICDIENIDNATDRCIAYSEVIIHFKMLKDSYYFQESRIDWKNEVNVAIIKDFHSIIDTNILELKNMIKINIEFKNTI